MVEQIEINIDICEQCQNLIKGYYIGNCDGYVCRKLGRTIYMFDKFEKEKKFLPISNYEVFKKDFSEKCSYYLEQIIKKK